jgi:hypothetical protein
MRKLPTVEPALAIPCPTLAQIRPWPAIINSFVSYLYLLMRPVDDVELAAFFVGLRYSAIKLSASLLGFQFIPAYGVAAAAAAARCFSKFGDAA